MLINVNRFREFIQPYCHTGSVPYVNEKGKFTENYGTQRITIV